MQALLQPSTMQLVTFTSVKHLRKNDFHTIISRHIQYNEVYRTIEIPQRTHILKALHNAYLKLASLILG